MPTISIFYGIVVRMFWDEYAPPTIDKCMKIVVLGSFFQACCWKVERLPKAGETFMASALSIEAGCKVLNVAIGTRRLGAEVNVLLGVGPNLQLAAEHVQLAEAAICAADLVYGQLETSLTVVKSAFRSAHRHGVRTVLNPSPWQLLPISLLDHTDILIVNEVEA